MEFYLDREKTLKFQLSSPDMTDEVAQSLVGCFSIDLDGLTLGFPVKLNDEWVATIEVPKLNDLIKNPKDGEYKATLALHNDEYYFKVWDEKVEFVKGRPDLTAKPIEEDEEPKKKKKKSKSKAVVEAVIVDDEVSTEQTEESVEVPEVATEGKVESPTEEDHRPDFQKNKGLKSYLDHLGSDK